MSTSSIELSMTFSELSWNTFAICFLPKRNLSTLRIDDDNLSWFKGILYTGVGSLAVSGIMNPSIWRTAFVTLGAAATTVGVISACSAARTLFSNNLEKWNRNAEGLSYPTRNKLVESSVTETINELKENVVRSSKAAPYALGAAAVLTAYFWTHAAYFGTSSNNHFYTRILSPLVVLVGGALFAGDVIDVFHAKVTHAIDNCPENKIIRATSSETRKK